MSTLLLEELLEKSAQAHLRESAITFLEGGQSFGWITRVLLRSGLSKKDARAALLPLRNHGDAYRAQALFHWLEQAEW